MAALRRVAIPQDNRHLLVEAGILAILARAGRSGEVEIQREVWLKTCADVTWPVAHRKYVSLVEVWVYFPFKVCGFFRACSGGFDNIPLTVCRTFHIALHSYSF